MKIVLVGGSSFIASAVERVCAAHGLDYLSLPHGTEIQKRIAPDDTVINFAISPQYRTAGYATECDYDLIAAKAAAASGAHFVMLSTRRVYPEACRWSASEEYGGGDETEYGRNKAISEAAIQDACRNKLAIFRLSNIFGYEYGPSRIRKSFLGQLLHSLKHQNEIHFDMAPSTRRDFLPVEICAQLLVTRATDKTTGVYNLGSGLAISCGSLADWIMSGFGGGTLIVNPPAVKDEFFLDMAKWRLRFALPIDESIIKDYCVGLGKRLQCEKY